MNCVWNDSDEVGTDSSWCVKPMPSGMRSADRSFGMRQKPRFSRRWNTLKSDMQNGGAPCARGDSSTRTWTFSDEITQGHDKNSSTVPIVDSVA